MVNPVLCRPGRGGADRKNRENALLRSHPPSRRVIHDIHSSSEVESFNLVNLSGPSFRFVRLRGDPNALLITRYQTLHGGDVAPLGRLFVALERLCAKGTRKQGVNTSNL